MAELPDGIAQILELEFTSDRWLAVWAQTLRIPEGPHREWVLDCIADWVAAAETGEMMYFTLGGDDAQAG